MTLRFPSPEFDAAVAAVCHGCATEAEMRALNALLRSDGRARDEYLLRVELHARLASEPDLFTALTEQAVPQSSAPVWRPTDALGSGPPLRPSASPALRQPAAWLVALAACFALLAVAVWGMWVRKPARPSGDSHPVAMLTRAVDARWSPDSGLVRVGGALKPGRLRLESGLAQVAFYRGARLVIEGPTDLRLVGPDEAVCPSGRLLAEVPPPARGFRLKTEHLEVVDWGTAFGLETTRGRTAVHVFDGTVAWRSAGGAAQSLSEGQAVVAEGRAAPRLQAAQAARFSPLLEFQQRVRASEAFRFEQWQFASARLNQDRSLLLRLDFASRGSADWTLRNLAEGNRAVPEATMVGCQWVEGRWPEKEALGFQSVNDRVRLVIPADCEALTLAVWVRLAGLDRQFNALFMCDGFEPGTIHWLIRRDGVLGLTVFGPQPGQFQILASPPVVTPDQVGLWLHVAVVLDGPGRRVVHYLNGEPVARLALELPAPFRLGPAELGNWNPAAAGSAAPDPVRNLSGALDELVLFNRALTDEEIRALHAAGKPQADP